MDYSTDPDVLFGTDATCILGPEVTQGPYYVTGELVRENIAESQEGIPLYMDIQLIDTNTCEPIPDIYMDLWHCNSTVSKFFTNCITYEPFHLHRSS